MLAPFAVFKVFKSHFVFASSEVMNELGGSSIALFGRVGGGIYSKASDVGADLSGKSSAEMYGLPDGNVVLFSISWSTARVCPP